MNTDTIVLPAKTPSAPETPAAGAAAAPVPPPWMGGQLKNTRSNVLDAIDKSGLDAETKALLVKRIGAVAAKFDLLQLDFAEHAYRAGTNFTFTITEL